MKVVISINWNVKDYVLEEEDATILSSNLNKLEYKNRKTLCIKKNLSVVI